MKNPISQLEKKNVMSLPNTRALLIFTALMDKKIFINLNSPKN